MIVGDDIREVEVAGEVSWNGAAEFLHAANGPHEAAPTHDIPFRLRLRVVHSSTGCVRAGDAVHGRQTVSTALDERVPRSVVAKIQFHSTYRIASISGSR